MRRGEVVRFGDSDALDWLANCCLIGVGPAWCARTITVADDGGCDMGD